jgi:hypothetical protein
LLGDVSLSARSARHSYFRTVSCNCPLIAAVVASSAKRRTRAAKRR